MRDRHSGSARRPCSQASYVPYIPNRALTLPAIPGEADAQLRSDVLECLTVYGCVMALAAVTVAVGDTAARQSPTGRRAALARNARPPYDALPRTARDG